MTSSEFLGALLDRESDIDSHDVAAGPDRWAGRRVRYWAVQAPGRVRRSRRDGSPRGEHITRAEFLARTGVAELFARHGVDDLVRVQAAVINPWGFVGYQLGEPLLMDLGYYLPPEVVVEAGERVARVPAYYDPSLPVRTWRRGRTAVLVPDGDRVATHVNRWAGRFTGRDGVRCLADLRTPACQDAVVRSALRHNTAVLAEGGVQVFSARLPAASLLAGCHLAGPGAVLALLRHDLDTRDETGTALAAYMAEFAHLEVGPEDLAPPDPPEAHRDDT